MHCSTCDANIGIGETRICEICDPTITPWVTWITDWKSKTPKLCDACFEKHMSAHKKNESGD
ncbi:MAG: hypothetical protein AAB362_01775 [Patescibacteria group bacterium]